MGEMMRGAPENASAAMKTIIARCQGLKKDPALRKVGVSLRDANGQFRKLDEILIELSEKWDGLDKNN